jgi:hypothetical protein
VVCVGIAPNDKLLFPAVAVFDDVPHSLVGGGSSESYRS